MPGAELLEAPGARLVNATVEALDGPSPTDAAQLEELIDGAFSADAERLALEQMTPGLSARELVLSDLGMRLEAWRRLGLDPDRDPRLRRYVEDGGAPMLGAMPTGAGGMAFVHNLPAPGTYQEDTELFFRNTERNDIPQASNALSGFGAGPIDFRIPNVGVLSGVRIVFKGTLTVGGTGAVTALYSWPWNVIRRLTVNINGQTQILSAEGMDYRARRQRFYRNPREEVSSAPATDTATGNPAPGVIANGTYAVTLVYDVPIAHDDYNVAGALFAQSDQNSLSMRLEPAAQTDLFSVAAGGTVTLSGTFNWSVTVFDIPFGDTQKGRIVLLPDMSWIHGFIASNQPFANTGEVQIALIRTAGQLLATYLYLDNGGAAQIDPLALSSLRFQYGANRRPREFNPPELLIEKNVHDYNGRIKPGYVVLDNEVDNPLRDLVYPKGVTELQIVTVIPSGTTLNANSHAHYVEETMFTGR